MAETAVWPIHFLITMLAAHKGSQCYFYSSCHYTRGDPPLVGNIKRRLCEKRDVASKLPYDRTFHAILNHLV